MFLHSVLCEEIKRESLSGHIRCDTSLRVTLSGRARFVVEKNLKDVPRTENRKLRP